MSASAVTAVTCKDCAYYSNRYSECIEWRAPVNPNDSCRRFLATDGSGKLLKVKGPVKKAKKSTANIAEKKLEVAASKAEPQEPCEPSGDLTRDRDRRDLAAQVVELLLQGMQRKEIAEKLGMTPGNVTRYIRKAADAGRIIRVGLGRYAVPGSLEATTKRQLNSSLAAGHIAAGLTAAEIADKYDLAQSSVYYHINKAVERGELVRVGQGKYEAGPALETDERVPVTSQSQVAGSQMDSDASEPDVRLDKLTRRLDELQDTMQSDLLKLGEWALRLDKRCDQLDARIDKLEETLLERLASLGLSIAGVQNDIVRVDQQLRNELDRVAAMQDTISDQLDELRDMVAEMQAEQWQRSGFAGFGGSGGSDMTGRLLSVLETQQRIMERQLLGLKSVALNAVERVKVEREVERANRTDNQEVA